MHDYKKYPDEMLLELLCDRGGMGAFEVLFERYYVVLCAYGRQYVDGDVAENVVQDVMMWVWENRRSLTRDMNLRGYLYRAVKNRCMSHIDHLAVKSKAFGTIRNNMADKFDDVDTYAVEELKRNIESALVDMPRTYREAFELNRFQRKTYDEIAEGLSISPKTVAYRIQQAVGFLRKRLKDYL